MTAASIAALILQYRYWILIPLTFIEGPIIAFVTGALSRMGYFDPVFGFCIFIARDMLMDVAWYAAGKYGARTRFAGWMLKKAHIQDHHLESVRTLWDTHGLRTMFVAKLSYGISQLFLAAAGMVNMPVARFFKYAFIVALIDYGVLFILGYVLGGAFGDFADILSNIQWVVAILALVIALYYIFTHFMRAKALEKKDEITR